MHLDLVQVHRRVHGQDLVGRALNLLFKTEGLPEIAFDNKGDIKNGALTLYTYKGGKRDQIAVVR